jgi:hypothetical protein
LSTLHDHAAMIDLNPLVIDRFRCKPPAWASAEEYHTIWYTLKDKISYLPGGRATGEVSYHACFHDLHNGLQTHVFAPLGLDIRGKWSLEGTLPGEPKAPKELGLDVPREGLYLREDVDLRCNIFMTSFVKKTLKKSHATLVEDLMKRSNAIKEKETAMYNLQDQTSDFVTSHPSDSHAPPRYSAQVNYNHIEYESAWNPANVPEKEEYVSQWEFDQMYPLGSHSPSNISQLPPMDYEDPTLRPLPLKTSSSPQAQESQRTLNSKVPYSYMNPYGLAEMHN